MKLIILTLCDSDEESTYLVQTSYSKNEIQKETEKFIEDFYNEGIEDWGYDDIIGRLRHYGFITLLSSERMYINA